MIGIAQTANLALCDMAIERAQSRTESLPGMICLYGPSGTGKSITASFVAHRRQAYYVQAKSVWTKKFFLQTILQEMGINTVKSLPEMLEMAAKELALSNRPLIIDEMDHLVDKGAVELVRDLYESSQAVILLIGEERLPDKLKKYERFHGRVLDWVPARLVDLDDARKLSSFYAASIEVADDLLETLVAQAAGSIRRLVVNLERIQEVALSCGWTIADQTNWASRPLYTGQAPKRRLL
ncbi:AAA family ATPase [Marinomonas transparens]|uniref:AAA family ATPase n=1 Tax=Marinomonas transparens TaxID=2795388 RepID=A0A934JRS7_9GAMM|nr:ATP-binding protein [Marinomonas transparens]MBJ7537182.1 AAA family ATPase [Marinomonas transparens]